MSCDLFVTSLASDVSIMSNDQRESRSPIFLCHAMLSMSFRSAIAWTPGPITAPPVLNCGVLPPVV